MHELFSIQLVSIFLVLAGSIMLMVSISQSMQLCKKSRPEFRIGWNILLLMIVGFISGYLAFVYSLLVNAVTVIELMLSVILFGGGAFVALVIKMSLNTIQNEKEIFEQLRTKTRDLEYQKFSLDEHSIVSIADNSGVITYVNKKFSMISGYSIKELIGSKHSIVNSGHHNKQFWDDLWETISTGEVWHGEIKNRAKNGIYFWVQTTIVPFLDDSGVPYQYIGIRNDVTFRKEQEIRQEQRQTRMSMQQDSLLKVARIATLNDVDFTGAIREILRISSETLGVARASLWLFENQALPEYTSLLYDNESKNVFNTFDIDQNKYPEFFRLIERCRILSTSSSEDDKNYREFYKQNNIQGEVKSILDASLMQGGSLIGLLRVEEVISKRIWHADEVHFLNAIADLVELSIVNSSRIKMDQQLTKVALELDTKNKDLEVALNASKEAGKAKSEFLSTISHEVRTPMNGIMGMLTLLKDVEEDEEKLEYIDAAYMSSLSLLELLNDILDFSRIEADKVELENIEFSVRHIMRNINDMMGASLKGKDIDFSWKVADKIPYSVLGDVGRLRQILMNLIGNAIKFTRQGNILVDIDELENSDEDICTLRFIISDTGIGIPSEQIESIFDAFTQGDGSITRKYGGTGLGLSICKSLVELMDGAITVSSVEGEGAKFVFTINLKHTVCSIYTGGSIPDISNIRVLLADNNKFERERIAVGLARYNLKSTWVEAGYQLIQRLRAAAKGGNHFQYAVLDSRMADLDTLELAKIIKSDPEICDTRLIMTIERGEQGQGKAAFEAGFHAYLTWPISSKLLIRCINLTSSYLGGNSLITRHTIEEFKEISGDEILFVSNSESGNVQFFDLINEIGFSCKYLEFLNQDLNNIDRYQLVLIDLTRDEDHSFNIKSLIGSIKNNSCIVAGIVSGNTGNYTDEYRKLGIENFITYTENMDLLEEQIDQLLLMELFPKNRQAL